MQSLTAGGEYTITEDMKHSLQTSMAITDRRRNSKNNRRNLQRQSL